VSSERGVGRVEMPQRVSDARRNRLARALNLIAQSAPPTTETCGCLQLAYERVTFSIEGAGALVVVLIQGQLN
jgi:hypothetical protein